MKIISGFCTSARIITALFLIPPDNSCGYFFSNPSIPLSAIIFLACSKRSFFDIPSISKPSATLDSIFLHGSNVSVCDIYPIRCLPLDILSPSISTSPSDGSIIPHMIFKSVLFPQPLAPTIARNSPSRTFKSMCLIASVSSSALFP